MSSLKEFQIDFLNAFYQNEDNIFTKHVLSKTSLMPLDRFSIYKSSITECLATSLRETYKGCEKIVGKDFFNGLAYTFVEKTPSTSPDLGDYGETFSEFVATFLPAQQLPYLADVCRLCWYFHLAYRGPANQPFDIQKFAAIPDDEKAEVVFALPKGAHLLASAYPLHAIWRLCQSAEADQMVDLNNGGIKLLIWKNENTVVIDELTDSEWLVAQALTQYLSVEKLEEVLSLKNIELAEALPIFLKKGWLQMRDTFTKRGNFSA